MNSDKDSTAAGSAIPDSGSAADTPSLARATYTPSLAGAADDADADDADGVYALEDAEDDHAYPSPSPQLPKSLAGLFYHTIAQGAVSYAPFDAAGHHGAMQLVPDPTFSALIHEDARALASTGGLVCLRGAASGDYYVANPLTCARLPRPGCDHSDKGDPAVVITFDLDNREGGDDDGRCFYRHYRVVVAFRVDDGIYAFESFSSRTWGWTVSEGIAPAGTVSEGIAPAETVVSASGVGALGCAFWRTTMGFILRYEPVSGRSDLFPAPKEVTQWPYWELGEMEGTLCATCVDEPVSAVVVIRLDVARRTTTGGIQSTVAGHSEGGCLRGRDVTPLRSQGKAEVVMWDPKAEMVVAMDLEGRTTRTITFLPGTDYYADFIPYVSLSAAVSASGPLNET